MRMKLLFSNMMSSSIFFDMVLFLFSSLVTSLRFIEISWLVLKLWQFSFIRDWPEIWKPKLPSSEFCPISEDWDKWGIQSVTRMFLIKCYWMMKHSKRIAFNIFKLLRKTNRSRHKITPSPLPTTHIRVKT